MQIKTINFTYQIIISLISTKYQIPKLATASEKVQWLNFHTLKKYEYSDDTPDINQEAPAPDTDNSEPGNRGPGSQGGTRSGWSGYSGHSSGGGKGNGTGGRGQGERKPGSVGGRPFISYIGTHPNDEDSDPDGLDHAARMQIEEQAISLIIQQEPTLQRTQKGNPGFDLFEANDSGQPVRWVEVKSMTGNLRNRPVGMSHTQFDFANKKVTPFGFTS